MESRRGHPRRRIMQRPAVGLDDLRRVPRRRSVAWPKGLNVGGHGRPLRAAACTPWASGRSVEEPATAGRHRGDVRPGRRGHRRRRARVLALAAPSCTSVPDGRPVPGTWATADELMAIAAVMGRRGRGVFEAATRLGEGATDAYAAIRTEVALMAEIIRRSGRPLTFGLAHTFLLDDLYRRVIEHSTRETPTAPTCAPRPPRAASGSCSAYRIGPPSTAQLRGSGWGSCPCSRSSRCSAIRPAASN